MNIFLFLICTLILTGCTKDDTEPILIDIPDNSFLDALIANGVDSADQGGLYQIDLESGLATLLVKSDYEYGLAYAAWSPKGDKLYYTYPYNFKEPSRVIQYVLETGEEKELYRTEYWPTCTALSPDGQWIVFTSYMDNYGEDDGCEIYTMRIDGSQINRLTNNGYCDWQPRWSP